MLVGVWVLQVMEKLTCPATNDVIAVLVHRKNYRLQLAGVNGIDHLLMLIITPYLIACKKQRWQCHDKQKQDADI